MRRPSFRPTVSAASASPAPPPAGRTAPLPASYDGYASCPLTTSRHTMLLAEFDYSMKPHPSFPIIDTTKERRDM